ncbi:MAG TPA: aldo/keto reductase, partial [Rectinemataceae bacterium]|nr:aldo/keto reductase [Rectinemataceae bacterium]
QGLGCMGMTGRYGLADRKEALATLEKAIELGVNFIDTADIYGEGENEQLLSEVVGRKRDRVFLATKFGFRIDDEGKKFIDASPKYIKNAIEKSLTRLNTDRVDLYYAHRIDPDVPVEETVGAMADLVKEGKVRYVGLSEASAESIRRAFVEYPIAAVQSEYSLLTRDAEKFVLPTCRELGIGFVPYSPLSRGLMTATFPDPSVLETGDSRRRLPRFNGEYLENNRRLVAEFAGIAAEKGCTPAQLALAWVLKQGDFIIPIPGTKRVRYLEENCGAVDVMLDAGDVAKIDALPGKYPNIGQRYDSGSLKLVNR